MQQLSSNLEKRKFFIFESSNYVENKVLFDEVSCQKCYQVQPKMRQCEKCSNVYCPDCFDTKTINAIKCCPNCQSINEVLMPNQRLLALSQIVFKCKFNEYGCATCLNMENINAHEDTCPFKDQAKVNLQENNQFIGSNSTLAYSMAQSSPVKSLNQGQIEQSNIFQSVFRQPETDQDFVTLAEFKQVLNEISILKQICAANFKNYCNSGHQLKYESRDSTITRQVVCDVCKREPSSQSVGSYRCGACDFDRCEQCFQQNRIF
ncbi:hypothetical protein TTHERM_00078880 (macronuclear) [Tetrahymena thermophila SB210]|uniref:Uncharacterized protein n=1 Tax=Tetrahymena thermophila (strain SB210) TaxID=312017 RepID=Q23FX6_TETTS|nr:hypothetical protein TTHERM_00078880 [Tetrahymena thermophila SB210]EAR95484.1 hypothetical protein TTHERM_00078880 [Tetrahymena thermophila SB210]|eukprot:XP_001015729.1 hypothetical protein TTHERM_00078880 [Tetrahymena thermophila SB210]